MGTTKMYAPVLVLLSLLAVGGFNLPSDFADDDGVFARCAICHIENAENIKTGPHNLMKCIECHTIADFRGEIHNATIPKCSSCHEDINSGIQHKEFGYLPKPYFVYNPNITEDDNGTYISTFEHISATNGS